MNHEDTKDTKKNGFAPALPEPVEKITREIVDSAFKVHVALGPGLLESVYEECLVHELLKRNIAARRQVTLPLTYDGVALNSGLRLDLVVDEKVIVELKAVERLLPIHEAQMLTYLKLSKLRLGLLINFNVVRIKEGIRRIVL